MQIRIPELEDRLALEPALADEQAVDDAALIVLPTGFFGGEDDFLGDDGRIGLGDFPFLELAGNDLFDLIL